VLEEGRGVLIAANKWDLVEEKDRTFKLLGEELAVYARAPVLRTSARTGLGVHRLPPALLQVHDAWARRAPTAAVNDALQAAVSERPPPGGGRYRYGTQVTAGPPAFVIFGGRAPDAPYRRFLENRFRQAFDLDGVPIRLRFRPSRARARGR
jgi:GTP-binding protein